MVDLMPDERLNDIDLLISGQIVVELEQGTVFLSAD